ncbi:hypothetical protein LZU85_14160 [Vibrio sp. IRLE0018]|uniref:hypothetical protein n=1 Tax=Vibrio floridensis TaxID=2908007 RepID=UPI001F37E014|nr:hypothetical protein [Vibrio floridensis]MCF8779946.1 hypothetical protein [Vibrio floridensis]
MQTTKPDTTPEQLITFQAHSAKMLMRVAEIGIKKEITISCELMSYESGSLSFSVHWFINNERYAPCDDNYCYTFFSVNEIDQWFLDANIALDLLQYESKAA